MLKPLIDQFIIDNPSSKYKDLCKFKRDHKCPQTENLPVVGTLAIKGSPEVKGTYFHHSIVFEVLSWVSDELKIKLLELTMSKFTEMSEKASLVPSLQERITIQ